MKDSNKTQNFDAVICATSFHWIPAEIRCSKIAQCLGYRDSSSEGGGPAGATSSVLPSSLILLWAYPPHPTSSMIRNELEQIHKKHDCKHICEQFLFMYEEKATSMFEKFHTEINESGYFMKPCEDLQSYTKQSKYTIARYIALLRSLSPYIGLDPEFRTTLLNEIEQRLVKLLMATDNDDGDDGNVKGVNADSIEFDVTHWYGSQVSFVEK